MDKFFEEYLSKHNKFSKFFNQWKEQNFSTNADESKLLADLEILSDNIGMREGILIAAFDYRNLSLAFFTGNLQNIIGYPNSFFRKKGLEAAMTMIHPDDRPELFRFQGIVFEVFNNLTLKEKESFEFSYTTRWVHKKTKEEKWFFARVRPYWIDDNGNMIFDLHIIVHLTTPPNVSGYDWSYSYVSEEGTKIICNKNEPVKLEVRLTKKQKQIAALLLEGLDSQEIANKLFISKNTVFTHRKNILKKIKAKNTAEMMKILLTGHII